MNQFTDRSIIDIPITLALWFIRWSLTCTSIYTFTDTKHSLVLVVWQTMALLSPMKSLSVRPLPLWHTKKSFTDSLPDSINHRPYRSTVVYSLVHSFTVSLPNLIKLFTSKSLLIHSPDTYTFHDHLSLLVSDSFIDSLANQSLNLTLTQ